MALGYHPGDGKQLKISAHVMSSYYCWRMNLSPCLLASVIERVGLRLSKKVRVGTVMSDALTY